MANQIAKLVPVVDYQAETLSVLASLIGSMGYSVEAARSGQEALERVDHLRPDLAIVAAVMPTIDGFELARELRNRYGRRLPIIGLTAMPEKDFWHSNVRFR